MKVRLLLKRSYTKQYSEDGFAMEAECKAIDIDLPDITNEDAKRNSFIGEWQIVGYEEIEAKKETAETIRNAPTIIEASKERKEK